MRYAYIGLLLLIAALLGGSAVVWFLAYEADPGPPTAAAVDGLDRPAAVHWQANGVARIEATSYPDALASLGYVHATQRTWSLALWRQTALGRLGEWFGRGTFSLDRHARRLGLGTMAEAAYMQLPDSTQRLLAAYASGVNAALRAGSAQRHDELVVLDVDVAPWEPWHTVAIERLVAWLATSPPSDSALATASPAARRFFSEDARFRQWLHVHGLDRSVAWGVRTAQGPALFQRYVYGTSALPLVHEVVMQAANGPTLQGASVPGTPFFIAGRTARDAWSMLPHSPLALTFAPVDSSALTTVYDRLQFRDGGETLLSTRRAPDRLPLGVPDARPPRPSALPDTLSPADSAAAIDSIRTRRRSVWQVGWPGLQPQSDASAWLSLPTGGLPAFQLMSGHGLRVQPDDSWTVMGAPSVAARFDGGVLIGQSAWARSQARLLREQLNATAMPSVQQLSARDSSAWAARRISSALPFLLLTEPADTTLLGEAITYLRNWDSAYDRASIGASIFESWLATHRAATDSLPFLLDHAVPPPPDDSLSRVRWTDSLRADSMRRSRQLQATLRQAIQSLNEQYGSDTRRWRWERVNARAHRFPVWSADSLVDRNLRRLSDTRFAALDHPGQGHPSALSGGSSLLDAAPAPTAAWEGWAIVAPDAPFMVRRLRIPTDVFLGRYAAPDRLPPPTALRSDVEARATTMLRPPP